MANERWLAAATLTRSWDFDDGKSLDGRGVTALDGASSKPAATNASMRPQAGVQIIRNRALCWQAKDQGRTLEGRGISPDETSVWRG